MIRSNRWIWLRRFDHSLMVFEQPRTHSDSQYRRSLSVSVLLFADAADTYLSVVPQNLLELAQHFNDSAVHTHTENSTRLKGTQLSQ